MKDIFRGLGRGVLYIFTLPAFLVALAIGAVYCLFLFIGLFFKAIFSFFAGKSIFNDLAEDIEADEILERRKNDLPSRSLEGNNGTVVVEQKVSNEEDPSNQKDSN